MPPAFAVRHARSFSPLVVVAVVHGIARRRSAVGGPHRAGWLVSGTSMD